MYVLAIILTVALLLLGFGSTILMLVRSVDMFTASLRSQRIPGSLDARAA